MPAALGDDLLVGAEARMRLGYLHWTVGRNDEARRELIKAGRMRDADVRYLAQFLLGWIAIARGDSAAAIPPLEAALATAARIPIGGAGAGLARAPTRRRRQGARPRANDLSTSGARMWIRGACFSTDIIRSGPARLAELRRGGEAVTRRCIASSRRSAAIGLTLGGSLSRAPDDLRSTTAVVSVSVSVKRGNNVVANLQGRRTSRSPTTASADRRSGVDRIRCRST